MKSGPTTSTETKSECIIAEILQHTCQLKTARNGSQSIHCFPIPRILKICPGRPAVEITKFVNINHKNGEIELPSNLNLDTIKARPWKEVTRYDTEQKDEPLVE
ncbi:hypothetical protein GALMADRAFT_257187 [Galerina marginata CBS 339.88]|uniref:Uncharacterized protein n=1 Tax=Galerina marginata (strain CBS 339.88) TaxID=685588 RepID=A0A067SLA3_GALM3|nr:hypothetical protein GALMADRAFT_257187 [Galerina marginata CBS 339.88]